MFLRCCRTYVQVLFVSSRSSFLLLPLPVSSRKNENKCSLCSSLKYQLDINIPTPSWSLWRSSRLGSAFLGRIFWAEYSVLLVDFWTDSHSNRNQELFRNLKKYYLWPPFKTGNSSLIYISREIYFLSRIWKFLSPPSLVVGRYRWNNFVPTFVTPFLSPIDSDPVCYFANISSVSIHIDESCSLLALQRNLVNFAHRFFVGDMCF